MTRRDAPLHRMRTQLRRLIVGVIGGTVVMLGVVMIVLPVPAVLVIPAGLAILGTEFLWARRLLGRLRSAPLWLARRREKLARDPAEQRVA